LNDNDCIKASTPMHIEYVSLPLNGHREEECLSHVFDTTEYSLDRNPCLEKSGNFYDLDSASYCKPDYDNFRPISINLPLEFSYKSAVRNNTTPISSPHGRF